MRSWWKTCGIVAGGLAYLGGILSSASAQFPPPGGGFGPPPGGGFVAPPPGFGMPPGAGGMPPGAGMMMPPGAGMPQPNGNGIPPGAFSGNPALTGQPADFPNAAVPSQEPTTPFSIKDDGMPNAFSELIDPRMQRPLRWQIDAGYTFLWFHPGNYPPLATTGNIADRLPGAIGMPGTVVLSTKPEPGPSSAFHTTVTYWVRDPEALSLTGTFFVMEQRTVNQTFNSDVNGNPLLARPYFDAPTRQEFADIRAFRNIFKGSMSDNFTTRVMGSDINLNWHSSNNYDGAHVVFLIGGRWLQLQERYSSFDKLEDVRGVALSATISDTFATYNNFYGGQVGAHWVYRLSRFQFDLSGKVAVGRTYQTIKVEGQTVVTNLTTTQAISDNFGLYSQPSNIGQYKSIHTSVLPEFEAKFSVDLTERLRFNVGYTFMWINNVVRPGDQMDRNINDQPLNAGRGAAPFVPPPPQFRQSNFYGHFLNVGLEFMF